MKINKSLGFFNNGRNCFGMVNFSPLIVFHQDMEHLKEKIYGDLKTYILNEINGDDLVKQMDKICIEEIKRGRRVEPIENVIEQRLIQEIFKSNFISSKVKERAYRISEQLNAAIKIAGIEINKGTRYMDMGCGSGVVAQTMKNTNNLQHALLVDVLDYRDVTVKEDQQLEFELFQRPYKTINTSHTYDLITITNVLHHSNVPFTVFETACKYLKTGGHLLIIESCIGITKNETLKYVTQPAIPHQNVFTETGEIKEDHNKYLELSPREKMIYGVFFDWLYNRIFVSEKINTPYNFGTIKNWNDHFVDCGHHIIDTFIMGLDQPAVLEYHTLHIVKKA